MTVGKAPLVLRVRNAPFRVVANGEALDTGKPAFAWGDSLVYRTQISRNLDLYAELTTRGNATNVLPWIENTRMDGNNTNELARCAVEIQGKPQFEAVVDVKRCTRAALIDGDPEGYWIGDARFDYPSPQDLRAYLPPYRRDQPTESTLSSFRTTYAPNWIGHGSSAMGTAGYQDRIGLLPRWAALWAITGDTRMRNATLANGLSQGAWSVHLRDPATMRPLRPIDWPMISSATADANPLVTIVGGTNGNYAPSHLPSLAYLPYLLTRRFYHYESLKFWATGWYWNLNWAYREKEKGISYGQVRQRGWQLNALAQALKCLRADDPDRQEYIRWWSENMRWYAAQYGPGGPLANSLGMLFYNALNGDGQPWMNDFVAQAVGFAWDLDLPVDAQAKTAHRAFRDALYAGVVARNNACPRRAAQYMIRIAQDASSVKSYFPSWHEVFAKAGMTDCNDGPLMDGPNVATDLATRYWGNMQPALAYAARHGYAGAKETWQRYTSMPNYENAARSYTDIPQFGVVPEWTTQSERRETKTP